jgi:hypothetical protein
MKKKLPIGISDFKEIIERKYYYVDKSLFIKDVLDVGAKAILIPRPRRFGKTLNISMLKYFFEKTKYDNSVLFKDLSIWKEDNEYREQQGKYPVVFLTFKDVSNNNWELCYENLKQVIANEYKRHDYLLKSDVIDEIQKNIYTNIMAFNATQSDYESSLKNLSKYLYDYHEKNVIILIDEYDTPIQQGFLNEYYDEIIGFMRILLSGALKDNSFLEKGILTGILRVAKESIFSGLNNFKVYSIFKDEFSTYFGLLEEDVSKALEYYGIEYEIEDVKSWYNGYIFGESVIYNPWSIMNFIEDNKYGLIPHWINTSSNSLVKKLITTGGYRFKGDIEKLIKGETVEKLIDENIVFGDLQNNVEAVWSFLLFTGYLKVISKRIEADEYLCELKIPNIEVKYFYEKAIMEWFRNSPTSEKMQDMLEGLMQGDIQTFEYYFKQFVINTMSYFDPTGEEPERVYQGFVLGLLVNLSDNYLVKSNRESGFGRYDVALIPRDVRSGLKGIIFEFKKANPVIDESIEEALKNAKEQIEKKRYEVELLDAGVSQKDIVKIAVAFKGKDVSMG